MKRFFAIILVTIGLVGTSRAMQPNPQTRMQRILGNSVIQNFFSKPELAQYAGRYLSYGDSIKKRLIITAPSWMIGAIIGFCANILPTNNQQLVESNVMGGLTLVAIGGTLKAIGGRDTAEALDKLHNSSEGEVVIAACAGFTSGALGARLTHKTVRIAAPLVASAAHYGAQGIRGSWAKLMTAIEAIKQRIGRQR